MSVKIIGSLALVAMLICGALFYIYSQDRASLTQDAPACTREAKICPDGTSVGRVGPQCEFAACPEAATSTPSQPAQPQKGDTVTVTAKLGNGTVALGEIITPISIVEDSRCPTDVQCVWAGTVRVKGTIRGGMGVGDVTFELGKTVTSEVNAVTLVSVRPTKTSATDIPPSDYVFEFKVVRR